MGMVISGTIIVIWLALFLHWICREEFYPIAGKGWRTKIFWGATFAMFNPLMLLLYFIFGFRLRPEGYSPRRLKTARIVVFTLFALSLPLALPIGRLPDKPRVLTRDSRLKAYGLSVKATALQSSSSWTGSASHGFESITYLDMQHIAILNNSDHPFVIKTAQKLQQRLLEAPFVKEVAYYPKGTYPKEGSRLPSLYIELDADHITGIPLPLARNMRAEVSFRFTTLQSLTTPWQPLPISSQNTSMTIKHQSTTFGYESYAAKYDSEAKDILKAMFVYMKSMMGTWYASASIPSIPDYFLGMYAPAPDMPFDANKSHGKFSGYDLLTHNHTTWWFEEPRPDKEAIAAYRDALLEAGWEDHSHNAEILRMERGNETLRVYRSDNAPRKGTVVPMIARYRNPFSREETDDVLAQLLTNETIPVDTLLFFGRQFRESASENVIAQFKARMESEEPDSQQGHLELSRFWEKQGELEKARKELHQAVVMRFLHADQSARFQRERQAELLGDVALAEALPTDQDLLNFGLIPLDSITTNIAWTVTPEKPFGFYAFGSEYDQEPDEELKVRTYVYRIVHDPFKAVSVFGWKPLPNRHWSLALNGNNSDGSHSWSLMDGSVSNGLWQADLNLQLHGTADTRIRIEIHQVDNETFECIISPLSHPVSKLLQM